MIDPVLLRTFLAVAEAGGFSEAARRCGLSQSTVSQQVRRLEASLGCVLFDRDTHQVALTGDGQALTGFARTILAQQDSVLRYFDRADARGRIRLGVCEDLVFGRVAAALREFRGTHPLVDVDLTVELSEVLHDRFGAGELDLVLAKRGRDGTGQDVWSDPLLWVGPPGLCLTVGEPVPLVVYPEPSITRARALGVLREHGVHWRVACVCERLTGLRAAVQAGLGVGLFAASVVPDGLVPLTEQLPAPGSVSFTLSRRTTGPGPVRALADAIRTIVPTSGAPG